MVFIAPKPNHLQYSSFNCTIAQHSLVLTATHHVKVLDQPLGRFNYFAVQVQYCTVSVAR